MNFFLNFLERNDRKRIIMDRESKEPYLVRYYLFLKDRQKFPFNIFLHQFLRSDPDDLHDHPWPFFSIILKGGYWEWIPKTTMIMSKEHGLIGEPEEMTEVVCGETKVWRGPGTFRFGSAKDYHRIEIEPNVDCWTVFIPGPQIREWGFLTHKNWDWRTFKWIKHTNYIDGRINAMKG
jgi:hypothetical protein